MTSEENPEFRITTSDIRKRRERLSYGGQSQAGFNPRYSLFIRRMRLILPLAALTLASVVFSWSIFSTENLLPSPEEKASGQTIGKNELLNPRFESKDEKNQPYTITARRAVQGRENENIVLLEKPMADMLLSGGNWIAITAENGMFRQEKQQLSLEGNVRLFHDQGYELHMAWLEIDLERHLARSAARVQGQGPAGTLEAQGLQADMTQNLLSFAGPARLVLYNKGANGIGEIFNE